AVLAFLAALPTAVLACGWDSDTLATEAKGLPGVPQIIVGRFERNPPYYYEMRLTRAAAAVEANPDDWEACDDACMACDRLGRGDEAVEWAEKKRERLDRADAHDPKVKEHRYRYHANAGTVRAHRWIRNGGDRKLIGEMEKARDDIKKAIELKPDAHFGREKYQLMAMEWIGNPPKYPSEKEGGAFPDFLGLREWSEMPRSDAPDSVKGLSGLIALGNAWESVDIYFALSRALNAQGKSGLAYMALLRCEELIDQGR